MAAIDALTGNLFMDGVCILGGFVFGVIAANREMRKKQIADKKLESLK